MELVAGVKTWACPVWCRCGGRGWQGGRVCVGWWCCCRGVGGGWGGVGGGGGGLGRLGMGGFVGGKQDQGQDQGRPHPPFGHLLPQAGEGLVAGRFRVRSRGAGSGVGWAWTRGSVG